MADRDLETRDRLLKAGARLFAAHGFQSVTVRDICEQASANVAAVNYHFHGKSGLYEEVLHSAIRVMQATTEEMRAAAQGRRPAEQLEIYIRIFVERITASRGNWIHQLMMQELSNPTPAFDQVMEQVLKPRLAYVRSAIAGIMGCDVDDKRVGLCVMSVQAQLLAVVNTPVAFRMATRPTADQVSTLARHIACFSIAGVRAIAST